jgi:hypothetical protein
MEGLGERTRGRVEARREAVGLAQRYRHHKGRPIAKIARRLGRAEATVKAYLYDPTGEKAREVKRRYRGMCQGCGAPTAARNGKGDAYDYCKTRHPGASADDGLAHASATRCASGETAMVDRHRRTTGREPTPAVEAATRSRDSRMATGRPREPSPTCTTPGRQRAATR